METLGQRLRQARNAANLTQRELALKSKVTQQMISKLETGLSHETADIVKLAVACGVDPVWLENGDGNLPEVTAIHEESNQYADRQRKILDDLWPELTPKDRDDLIRRASEWVEQNQYVVEHYKAEKKLSPKK
jgi:transcriptional regulator with XRE-family HTH domain